MAELGKALPVSLSALSREDAPEEDKSLAAHLQLCAELAGAGPGAMRRRGVTVGGTKPWTPPESVKFEHPKHGELRLKVATGEVGQREK